MSVKSQRILFGVLMVAAGFLFLLQNLGVLPFGPSVFAGMFAAGGAAFLAVLLNNRQNWWAAIPGIVLLSLAALLALNDLAPAAAKIYGGSLFLAGIGLSFWVVYLLVPQNWWAIIPGGVLFTLAAVAGVASFNGLLSGAVLFLGLAATFALVALLSRTRPRRMTWPWIPAAALAAIGVLMVFFTGNLAAYLLPVTAIAGGLALVWRSLRTQ